MQHPEYIYYAALAMLAMPVAWFARSRIALLVIAVWAVGQTTYLIGMPEPQTQAVIYAAASVLGMRCARSTASTFAAVLFIPLFLVSLSETCGWMNPSEAWWSIFWVALTQAMSLPFNPQLGNAIKRLSRKAKEGDGMGMLRTVNA